MRLTDAGLLFAMLLLVCLIADHGKIERLNLTARLQAQYDKAMDNAVDDAMFHLVEKDSGREVVVNKEEAVERFFTGLFVNMGVMDNPGLKNQLRAYVPVIGIIERDGFWVYHHRKGGGMKFSEKYRFSREEEKYRIDYTLSDYIYVTKLETGAVLEGDYHDVGKEVPCECLEERLFDEIRRDTVIRHITKIFSRYINEYNAIAQKYGIQYVFSLPVIEKEDWYRTIDDISMVAFMQGYPLGGEKMGYYNRTALSGARVRKIQKSK